MNYEVLGLCFATACFAFAGGVAVMGTVADANEARICASVCAPLVGEYEERACRCAGADGWEPPACWTEVPR